MLVAVLLPMIPVLMYEQSDWNDTQPEEIDRNLYCIE